MSGLVWLNLCWFKRVIISIYLRRCCLMIWSGISWLFGLNFVFCGLHRIILIDTMESNLIHLNAVYYRGWEISWSIFTESHLKTTTSLQTSGTNDFWYSISTYGQISNIRHTSSQTLHVSRLVLQLSLPNPLNPGIKSGMKMDLEQRRQAMLQLHLIEQQFYCLLRCDLY